MKRKEKILLLFLVLGLVLIGCGAAKSAPSGEKTEHLNLYGVDFSLEDKELFAAAVAMRTTEPGDVFGYMQHWLSFQDRFNEVLPMIPIYSNIYFS